MLATQSEIDRLASRIENAYRVRRPNWAGAFLSPQVWTAAAMNLVQARQGAGPLPSDPELFVASQPKRAAYPDPWAELTGDEAVRRYRSRVGAIIRGLRKELAEEVKLAEDRVCAGQSIARVLGARSRRLSPLGRYLVARRAGRTGLASRFVPGACEQHRACPLYRQACEGLLPAGAAYPDPETCGATLVSNPGPGPILQRPRPHVLLN